MANAIQETHSALNQAATDMARFYDHDHREAEGFEVGDKVWLDGRHIKKQRPIKKLDDRWFGPFEIQKVLSQNAYRLKLPQSFRRVHPVFHVSLLRRWHPDPLRSVHSPLTQSPYLLMVGNPNMRWSVSSTAACITESSNTWFSGRVMVQSTIHGSLLVILPTAQS